MTKENLEYEIFTPSKELAKVVYNNITKPTGEDLEMIKDMLRSRGEEWPPDEELKQSLISTLEKVIEEEIYDTLTSFAKHCLYYSMLIEGSALVSEDGKFVAWIFLDFIERLCLNVKGNLSPVFDRLYGEMVEFYSIPRQYAWGRVSAENGELKVFVNDGAFKPPDFNKLDSKRWHVAK